MKNLYYLFILSFFIVSCEEQLPQRYTLTIQKSPEEGGTVFPSTGQHFETSQVAVSATPSENWKFVKWGGDGNGSSLNPLTVTINSDILLVAEFELIDADNDGVTDALDRCPDTPSGSTVDENGCATSQLDSDGDGITDDIDQCPDTPENTDVNEEGCAYIYLAENGITLKAISNSPVSKWYKLNGVEYYISEENELPTLLSENYELDKIITSKILNMNSLFVSAENFNGEISTWDVSNVTDMSEMFKWSEFDQDLSEWDVSNVTNMESIFHDTPFNHDISNWDVSNVTNMKKMFYYTSSFNNSIGNWDVSNVTDMSSMFRKAESFNQPIGGWNVSNVTNMRQMFSTSSFNQPIGDWDVSSVEDMFFMFSGNLVFDQPIGNWDVSNVTNMKAMFQVTNFNQDISNWDVSNVTDMMAMFYNQIYFNQDISKWDVSNVTNMKWMFKIPTNDERSDDSKFNQDLSIWNVDKCIDCSGFRSGASIYTLPIPNFTNCNPN